MDAIRSYIDHMFRGLPSTVQVVGARRELLQRCDDRYHELRAEGASEHEAVGAVIAQFGNLDEFADELGIRPEVDGLAQQDDDALDVSGDEAEQFLRVRRTGARLIALGIVVILLGVSQLIWFNSTAEADTVNVVSFALFFLGIAIAVALFIVGGMSMGRYDRYEHRTIRLDGATLQHYRDLREAEQGRFTASIVIGVTLIILGVGLGAVGGILVDQGAGDTYWMVSLLPLVVSLGVAALVIGGIRRGSLDRLTSEGDYQPNKRKQNDLVGRIAGPYWMLALLIFLAWGFIGDGWDRSWMVWPIAGVLFALIAVTAESWVGDRGGSARRR